MRLTQHYPRWIHTRDNVDIIVPNREQHQQFVDYEVGEDGKPKEQSAHPPTIEEVIAAGYSEKAAQRIRGEELYKQEHGIKPYGPNEPPTVKDTAVKEFETRVANADAMADTVEDPDPLGLFQGKE